MKFDFGKYALKLRSLPNSKNIRRYLDCLMYYMAVLAAYNLITICLVYDDFTPRFPALFALAIPVLFFYTYHTLENEFKNVTRDMVKDVITYIRLKQTQSLIETLEENPEILQGTYKKKSLLYWARHHKNLEANSIIIDVMKKQKKAHSD
ncbi:hypothetical protein DOM21_14600 [Bacteriovorax stolpii]|uniref:hypothetical protein n=1 Tax=Bacteriovorax stolpii TaxID=960 RepID=UPI00115A3F30|nr:hypothetical protein [Bacteriovorax stolpii]QDK42657.1 hypothetical protein DOM21_14600 [Bacteriovorax stolpii]